MKYFEKKYEVPGVQVNFPLMHQAAQLWLMSIDESEYEVKFASVRFYDFL